MTATQSGHTLINDYLTALGVPHDEAYSNSRVDKMPFKTLFGLSKLLEEYGIKSEAYYLADKTEISSITPPFLANTALGEVIVTSLTPSTISYLTQGVEETVALQQFMDGWDGKVMLSFPGTNAAEPNYKSHQRLGMLMKAKKWVLLGCALALLVYLIIANGIYHHVSTLLIAAIDIGGLYFTYL